VSAPLPQPGGFEGFGVAHAADWASRSQSSASAAEEYAGSQTREGLDPPPERRGTPG